MVKLIALDVDGTLVKKKNIVSKVNIEAINEARKKGIKICIATGRNIKRVEAVAKAIGIDKNQEYIITLNGGATYKYNENGEPILIDEHLFTLDDFKFIYDKVKDNKLSAFSYAKDSKVSYVVKKDLFTWVLKKVSHRKLIKYKKETLKDTSYKIIVYGKTLRINKLKEDIKDKEYEIFFWSYVSKSSNIEINPKGVDKLYSLQMVASEYGINNSEIVYFGDGDNDKKAMKWVGRGIAMGNAKDEIKENFDESTETNKKNGVGVWIINNLLSN